MKVLMALSGGGGYPRGAADVLGGGGQGGEPPYRGGSHSPGIRMPDAALVRASAPATVTIGERLRYTVTPPGPRGLPPFCGSVVYPLPRGKARCLDVNPSASLPVLESGRVKPLDSVSRNALLMIRSKSSVYHQGRFISSNEWMLDMMFRPSVADQQPVFVIDNPTFPDPRSCVSGGATSSCSSGPQRSSTGAAFSRAMAAVSYTHLTLPTSDLV